MHHTSGGASSKMSSKQGPLRPRREAPALEMAPSAARKLSPAEGVAAAATAAAAAAEAPATEYGGGQRVSRGRG